MSKQTRIDQICFMCSDDQLNSVLQTDLIISGHHGDGKRIGSFHQRDVESEAEPWSAKGVSGGVSPGCPGVSFRASGTGVAAFHR